LISCDPNIGIPLEVGLLERLESFCCGTIIFDLELSLKNTKYYTLLIAIKCTYKLYSTEAIRTGKE